MSVSCNKEFWHQLAPDLTECGYRMRKAQAFSIYSTCVGVLVFFFDKLGVKWTGTHDFSQDESQDSP